MIQGQFVNLKQKQEQDFVQGVSKCKSEAERKGHTQGKHWLGCVWLRAWFSPRNNSDEAKEQTRNTCSTASIVLEPGKHWGTLPED